MTEIIWLSFWASTGIDISSVQIDFGKAGNHVSRHETVQFHAKYSNGTAEGRMFQMVKCLASIMHKI